MYEYAICNQPDKGIFERQCLALEDAIRHLKKIELLQDVDGSEVQVYSTNGKKITVHNSFYVNAVFVKSEIDLVPYFKH